MLSKLKTRLAIFQEETRGSLTLEAVILLPVLLWAFMAMFVFFDAFRARSISQKAAYTIGDMISRETDFITPTYMDSARELLNFLAEADDDDSSIRVSIVSWDEDSEEYRLRWSRTRGGKDDLGDSEVRDMADRLPEMADNEEVIVVETWVRYHPLLNIDFLQQEIETYSFTRPRFAPQVVWAND